LALTNQIAERARREPSRFAELAREFSEDETTRERGGSGGGITATQFVADAPAILDAVAIMKPGEVSYPIRTRFGLHVVLRREAPEAVQLSGRRIVIGHDSTIWLQHRQREGTSSHRTREEARTLAQDLARQARATPGQFAELVARYSEHRDAADGGDMGVWSTREPTEFPRQIDTLTSLEVGAVSVPIETPFGFEVLARTPVKSRPTFAASIIRIHFDPTAPDENPQSKRSIGGIARDVADTLLRDNAQFESLQQRYCCERPERWALGRGEPEMTAAVRDLLINTIARDPVVVDYNYLILKRIDPDELPAEPEATSELPAPAGPDLEYLVAHTVGGTLAKRTREIGQLSRASLELSSEQERAFTRLNDDLATAFEKKPPEERRQAFQGFERDLEHLLGPKKFERYRDVRNASITKMMLRN
jgi:hypothetical protein